MGKINNKHFAELRQEVCLYIHAVVPLRGLTSLNSKNELFVGKKKKRQLAQPSQTDYREFKWEIFRSLIRKNEPWSFWMGDLNCSQVWQYLPSKTLKCLLFWFVLIAAHNIKPAWPLSVHSFEPGRLLYLFLWGLHKLKEYKDITSYSKRKVRNVLRTNSLICRDIPTWVWDYVLHIFASQKMAFLRCIGELIGVAADFLAAPASTAKNVFKTRWFVMRQSWCKSVVCLKVWCKKFSHHTRY